MHKKFATSFVIKNGHIIDPANNISKKTNIFVTNGIISAISDRSPEANEFVINASDMLVTPGLVDLHTHLREPGYEYKEDIQSGSRAAIAGGFTSILAMPNTMPTNDSVGSLRRFREREKEISLARLYPVCAITRGLAGKELTDIKAFANEKVIAISDDGSCVQSEEVMKRAFELAFENDLLVISHPEDFNLSASGVINEGVVAKELGVLGIPSVSEEIMIERDIRLAKATNVRLHIAHISTLRGLNMIRAAKRDGVRISCEVTPHHLFLSEEDVRTYRANAKMKPPLRTKQDKEALITGIKDGSIDAIATDHAPHAPHEKTDLKTATFGVIGMETSLAVCLRLVLEGHITMERLIGLMSYQPAKIARIPAGTLSLGNPADITVIDPNKKWRIDAKEFRSKSSNCPFDGWDVVGKAVQTIVGGKIFLN